MKILVVEDDVRVASYLKKGLEDSAYTVDVIHDGEEAVILLQSTHYDLVTLDIGLPKIDGYSVLREIRKAKLACQVLMLTARDKVEDKILGLDTGADAYLVKPFSFSELLAQVRSLLRRRALPFQSCLRISDLELDSVQHRVTRAGVRIELTQKEFLLLHILMRRKSEVLSRAVLADQVWGINFDSGTNVVDVHIRRLRAKVDDPFEKKLIHTIRGLGYVLSEDS